MEVRPMRSRVATSWGCEYKSKGYSGVSSGVLPSLTCWHISWHLYRLQATNSNKELLLAFCTGQNVEKGYVGCCGIMSIWSGLFQVTWTRFESVRSIFLLFPVWTFHQGYGSWFQCACDMHYRFWMKRKIVKESEFSKIESRNCFFVIILSPFKSWSSRQDMGFRNFAFQEMIDEKNEFCWFISHRSCRRIAVVHENTAKSPRFWSFTKHLQGTF